MPMATCSVLNCKSRAWRKDGTSFHKFPKDLTYQKIWIKATGRDEQWQPTKNSKMCSIHFEEDCYLGSQRCISLVAIPTINVRHRTIYPYPPTVAAPPYQQIKTTTTGISSNESRLQLTASNSVQPAPSTKVPKKHQPCVATFTNGDTLATYTLSSDESNDDIVKATEATDDTGTTLTNDDTETKLANDDSLARDNSTTDEDSVASEFSSDGEGEDIASELSAASEDSDEEEKNNYKTNYTSQNKRLKNNAH